VLILRRHRAKIDKNEEEETQIMDANSKEYIDVDDALKRVGGNMGLLKRLLDRFITGDYFNTLETAMGSGDMEEISRQIHSLKGVSANLSLVKIREISAKMELEVKNNLDCSASFAELKQAYGVTMEKITEIIS
jgi:HPt (histidine-containing phosphotransfer) domain-containing protein